MSVLDATILTSFEHREEEPETPDPIDRAETSCGSTADAPSAARPRRHGLWTTCDDSCSMAFVHNDLPVEGFPFPEPAGEPTKPLPGGDPISSPTTSVLSGGELTATSPG